MSTSSEQASEAFFTFILCLISAILGGWLAAAICSESWKAALIFDPAAIENVIRVKKLEMEAQRLRSGK